MIRLMRIFLFAIIFFLRGSCANAQLAVIDSLKHQLDIAKEDTSKLELLIQAYGGEIRVETKETEYTRFIITLPV